MRHQKPLEFIQWTFNSIAKFVQHMRLSSAEVDIQAFISTHHPLSIHTVLCDASFWTASQAKFLREQISNDADWAGIVDMLDARLRKHFRTG